MQIPVSPYASVVIKLLQGPVYSDEKDTWRELQSYSAQLHEYFGKIGIRLVISEDDGFARVKQDEAGEGEENALPRLMRKVSLNYETTLLCVLIREMLEEFDVRSEGTRLFVTQKDIKERIELYYKERTNKSKLWRELSKPIGSLERIGILKLTREDSTNEDNNQYEVKRIVKALIDNERLQQIHDKMKGHFTQNDSEV